MATKFTMGRKKGQPPTEAEVSALQEVTVGAKKTANEIADLLGHSTMSRQRADYVLRYLVNNGESWLEQSFEKVWGKDRAVYGPNGGSAELRGVEQVLHMQLMPHIPTQGWRSEKQIAELSGCAERTARTALKWGFDEGLLHYFGSKNVGHAGLYARKRLGKEDVETYLQGRGIVSGDGSFCDLNKIGVVESFRAESAKLYPKSHRRYRYRRPKTLATRIPTQ